MSGPSAATVYQSPRPAWIKVGTLLRLGIGPHPEGDRRGGMDVPAEAPGLVLESIPRTDVGGLLLVRYRLVTGDRQFDREMIHYIPDDLARRRGPSRRDRAERQPVRRTHG
ncbi:hypothetical protein SAMN05421630_115154 [Prauserella marina]|uniref:Uncharacterized protein n=1 Tax=Prauserella marina TaxID=530584 RepID=A0A1G6Z941_9PSEU|nr:hypothetical protein DES30_112125 [Prauserella marina]SDD98296.1 hypothetical protein SAMN05421630_115154 [Prauserella marina]